MAALVSIGGGHRLAPGPAASYARMRAAGCPAGVTSSYRSTAYQAYLRTEYLAGRGNYALPPGQSKHETGYSLDLHWAPAQWVRAHPEHGWRFTNADEWWHVDYFLVADVASRTTPALPDPLEEDVPLDADDKEWLRRLVRGDLTTKTHAKAVWEYTSDHTPYDAWGLQRLTFDRVENIAPAVATAAPQLTDADLDRIAAAVTDEQHRRLKA